MKFYFKIARVFLLLVWFSSALIAQEQPTNKSWEQIKKQAAAEHKMIFVDLYYTGCMPCAQMDQKVFPDPKVTSFLQDNFITLKTDAKKDEVGKMFDIKYGITGYPAFLFLNSDGKIIDIYSGFKPIDEFISVLESVKDKAQKKVFKKYSTKFKETDYPEFYLLAIKENRKTSFEEADNYLKNQPSLLAETPFVIISGLGIRGEYDDFFLKNLDVLEKDYGHTSVGFHVLNILRRKKIEYEKNNDLAGFQKLINGVQPIYTTGEFSRYQQSLLKDFGTVKKQVIR